MSASPAIPVVAQIGLHQSTNGQTPRTDQSTHADRSQSSTLQEALEQSREVKSKFEACADDLFIANIQIEAAISNGLTSLPARQALATGVEVATKVQECADDMRSVTETLATGIDHHLSTATALDTVRAELADARVQLMHSKAAEETAMQSASHDAATGLPNRVLFDSRLEQAIASAKRHGWILAVMYLDLDGFKSINDSHGHATGDQVLQVVAHRLATHAREEDTVCRNGGDEFLYLLVNPQAKDNVEQIASAVAERLSQQIATAGYLLAVKASIGIAMYPDDAQTIELLVHYADAAMYVAKQRRSDFAFAGDTDVRRTSHFG